MDRGNKMTTQPKTVVVYSCAHANPESDNDRFSWLGDFLYDIRPDYVIDLGDGADMKSLNSFDSRKPTAVVAQSYQSDIDCYLDSQDRIRAKFKKQKRKRPAFFGFEGNHEHRIKTAIEHDPRLEGDKYGISFKHLEVDRFFDEYHEYEYSAPKIANYDGVDYAHYITSGNMSRPISGIHHAYALIQHRYNSAVVGHTHKRDLYFKDGAGTTGAIGLVAGCYKGKEEGWAGQSNHDWWKGVVVLRSVENSYFEPQFVSLRTIRRTYG